MENKGNGKSSIVRGFLAAFILMYLVFAFLVTDYMFASQKYTGTQLILDKNNDNSHFARYSLQEELKDVVPDSTLLSNIDLSTLEKNLRSVVNIEDARVNYTTGGKLKVKITPVIPVARVFSRNGESYYINRAGKKVSADYKFKTDVPVITGFIDDSIYKATDLLPLIDYINNDSLWNNLTSSLKVNRNGDVILIPAIKGHVVNLGKPSPDNLNDKFDRLRLAYKEIMPNKGWQYYDTISLKYAGQIVATRARKREAPRGLVYELADSEEVSPDNMIIQPLQNN